MSGWNNSDRRERLPANWFSELVPAVKRAAGGRCQARLPSGKRCPRDGTDVDHKVPGDDHRLANLQLLCAYHHAKKTAREAYRAKRAKRASGRRAPEEHPGRLR